MQLRYILIIVATVFVVALLVAALWYQKRRKDVIPPALGTVPWTATAVTTHSTGTWSDDIVGEPRIIIADECPVENIVPMTVSNIEVKPTKAVPAPKPVNNSRKQVSEDWIVFHVLANPGKKFMGYDLLQTLLACGLQHGPMSIFHYYQNSDQRKESWFSLASALEPGTFNLDDMGAFSTTGLTLFMNMNVSQPMTAYAKLLETLQQLVEDLPGKIFDQKRQPCTQNYLEQCQRRITRHCAAMTLEVVS